MDDIGSFALVKDKDIKPVQPGGNNSGVNTGDAAVIMPYVILVGAMAVVMAMVLVSKKKFRKG